MAYTLDQYAEMWQRIAAGGYVSDDFPLTISEIKAWILEGYSASVTTYLRSKRANEEVTGIEDSWLKKYSCVAVKEECECDEKVWYYELTEPILSLPNDMGLAYVTACGGTELFKAKMAIANRIKNLEVAAYLPPTYFISGNRIYFTSRILKVTIWAMAQPSADEPFNIPADVGSIEILQKTILQKIQAFISAPKERINDAADLPTP